MRKILYLFPDTNLLIQCLPVEQLGWGRWKEFDEIHLMISRPVQKEIDKHKNSGSDRLATRGRKATSLLREVITGSVDHKMVREAGPSVKLFVRPDIKPSDDLAEILNYGEPDDVLVGVAHSFLSQNTDSDVRVLTHDSGPMASAKMVGVPIAVIPDEWLLKPEQSEADKRIKFLEAEVARLKQAEPSFDIACLDITGAECDKLDQLEAIFYDPISDNEVINLTARLKARCPMATDFGPRESSERNARLGGLLPLALNVKEIFTPATDQEINEYGKNYTSWLEKCEEALRNLHTAMQRVASPPSFEFLISNEGTRPATDALVTFAAKGRFGIMPPPYRPTEEDEESEDKQKEDQEIALPKPPMPPKGSWKPKHYEYLFGQADLLASLSATRMPPLGLSVRPFLGHLEPKINLNAFYYKPNRLVSPAPEFSLECKQWRHSVKPESFEGQISVSRDADEISGAVECTVHAGNASQPTTKLVPVKIKVKHVKASTMAAELVERIGSAKT
jgi:hypothetical protein